MSVFRQANCSIEVDQEALIRHLSRVTDGAADRFVARVTAGLEEVRGRALPLWPVRSGVSQRALKVEKRLTPKTLEVMILDDAQVGRWGFYAYKITYSIHTAADLDSFATEAAARAKTPGGAAKIKAFYLRKLEVAHGRGAPTEALAGKRVWNSIVRPDALKLQKTLIPELQRDLERLAGG